MLYFRSLDSCNFLARNRAKRSWMVIFLGFSLAEAMVKVYWLLLWEEWLLDTVWSFSVGPVATNDAIVEGGG